MATASRDEYWLKDKSLEDSDDLPEPDILAQEITDELQSAVNQFAPSPPNAARKADSRSLTDSHRLVCAFPLRLCASA